jgi:branched-chain amino acid transport system ATP-binding protein
VPSDAPLLLHVSGVSVRFGGLLALDDVEVDVWRGCITGLIGPNGAGKTTMFNVLSGLLAPSSGRVLLEGDDITRWTPHRRGRAGVARTFQRLELFARMNVEENLIAAAESARPLGVLGRGRAESRRLVDQTIELLGLQRILDRMAGDLPTGLGRMVELGRALCTRPRVLLLDEPGSGLDAGETATFRDVLREVVRTGDEGPGILLVEHDMGLVMEVCDHIVVLDFGRRIADGTPAEIADNDIVRAAYLGDADVA